MIINNEESSDENADLAPEPAFTAVRENEPVTGYPCTITNQIQ
jgi:hypothetical protein